jgi:hypothetical protein
MAIIALSTSSAMAAGLQVGSGLVPPESLTTWAPGVRGIPTRTRVCATVNAADYGNGRNDASAGIQAAVNACPVGEVVQLSAGTFTVNDRIQINKGITLRGAGVRITTLQKTNSPDEQELILLVGPSPWPHLDEATAVNLTADAVQGARSVTVANSAGFAPGQFVKLDEDDYTTATWMPMPARIGGNEPEVLATDRVVWQIHRPRDDERDLPLPAGLSWHSRRGRPLAEIKEITAVNGNTITFSTPVHITYTTAKAAQLVRYAGADSVHVRDAGVEDMALTGGSNGNVSFSSAAYSWAKNIECTQFKGLCVDVKHSFRVEIRDSHIHHAVAPVPGGGAYAISLQHGSSEILIENNIVMNANKVIVVRSAGAGSVVGYNYMDNALIAYAREWMEVGLNASHMVGSHHVLFEGNLSFNYDSDDRWGNAIAMTVFRNHLTGFRRDFESTGNVRAAGLMFGSWWHAFIGNVLGEPGRMDGWIYEDPGDGTYGGASSKWRNGPTIWKLGYDLPARDQSPDPKVRSSVVRDGNFDYVTNTVRWDHAPRALPDSLYLTAKPAFFGSLPWPWVDPTGTTKVWTLPARVRFETLVPSSVTGLRVTVQ